MLKSIFSLLFQRGTNNYRIKIAETTSELEKTFAFRQKYFVLDEQETESHVYDKDKFDEYCDHLIALNIEDEIIGTYRLLRAEIAKKNIGFYAATEFNLDNLLALPLLEIGRACVHPDYRTFNIISMLWAGLITYIEHYHLHYFGGSASIPNHGNLCSQVYAYAKAENLLVDNSLWVHPHEHNRVKSFDPDLIIDDLKSVKAKIPAIIKGYFSAQVKIASYPAHDPIFDVNDFYILAEYDKIKNSRVISRIIKHMSGS